MTASQTTLLSELPKETPSDADIIQGTFLINLEGKRTVQTGCCAAQLLPSCSAAEEVAPMVRRVEDVAHVPRSSNAVFNRWCYPGRILLQSDSPAHCQSKVPPLQEIHFRLLKHSLPTVPEGHCWKREHVKMKWSARAAPKWQVRKGTEAVANQQLCVPQTQMLKPQQSCHVLGGTSCVYVPNCVYHFSASLKGWFKVNDALLFRSVSVNLLCEPAVV